MARQIDRVVRRSSSSLLSLLPVIGNFRLRWSDMNTKSSAPELFPPPTRLHALFVKIE
jgi:hypothetical protein